MAEIISEKQQVEQELLDPKKLFRTLDDVCANAKPLEPLWGYYLYKKALTSIVSDPGLGKTTLGYGLGIELALGKPFLNIVPEEPVTVLYMDLESSDSLVKSRKILIGCEEIVSNFFVYNIVDFYFPQIALVAKQFCLEHHVNLVFIDNQTTAFNTRDENDNSEAARQMRLIRTWANESNVACVIFHHTSKGNLPGIRKGTGAFARARLADICINLDIPDDNCTDIIRWEVVKNRLVDEKTLWYLKKAEGKFLFTEQPLGSMGIQTNTQVYKAQQVILEFMKTDEVYKYNELKANCSKDSIKDEDIDHAIRKLYQQGRLVRPKYGFWQKKGSSLVR